MVACMSRIYAAAATPWAWLPEENATTPPARLSCGIEATLLKAPRNLKEPVRWSISGFRKTLVPTRSLSTGKDSSGVRMAKGAITRAAASISAGPIGRGCSVITDAIAANEVRARHHRERILGDEARLFHAGSAGQHRADRQNAVDEGPGRRLPGVIGGKFDAGRPRNVQRGEAGIAQIMIQRADRRIADDVAGALHRERRDRQATRERFQQDQAERVGLAGKHEDVGRRIDVRQFLAVLFPQKDRVRIGLLQRDARRAITDDHLGAGPVEVEEGLEILLHRDPADR